MKGAACAWLLAALLAPAVDACETAPGGTLPGPPAGAARAPDSVSRAAARCIARLAIIDLRLREIPRSADAHICEHLLALALEADPGNAEIVRIASWISDLSEDDAMSASYLRRLVELDPADTYSQYRLISNLLRSIQNADERLARFEAFLGDKGSTLHPSIRSRLAHEAATLLMERGDDGAAVEKLKLALTLDSTNKDAAVAAYKYYRSRLTDPAGQAELLVNLLMADPVNFDTHEELARVFASGGAFDAAKRFQSTAATIMERASIQQDIEGLVQTLCVDWAVDGPAKVVSELNTSLEIRRNEQIKLRQFMEEQLIPMQDVPTPEEVRLEPKLDKLRLLAAMAAGDSATADSAAADFRASYDKPVEYLENPPPNVAVDIADPGAEARALRLERAAVLLWADRQADYARTEIEAVSTTEGQDPQDPLLLEARAWAQLRSAEPAAAVELFRPLVERSPPARVGLALAMALAGRKDESLAEFVSIMREMPMTPEAMWAWERAKSIAGRSEVEPETVKKLRDINAGVPIWVDRATTDPDRLMTLAVELVETSLDAAEPATLRVRLGNVSQIPLGVGPGRTIDSRLLLSPVLQVGLELVRQGIAPELIDAERRLRLAPRESLEFECWPDPGLSGWLVESLAVDAVRTRWNVIQGFTRGPYGQIVPGPMCLRASSKILVRPAMVETGLSAAELSAKVADASEDDLFRLSVAARALLLSRVEADAEAAAAPRLSDEDAGLLAGAFADRYARCSPMARRLLASSMPHARQTPALSGLDAAIRADADPAITAIALVSRVTDPADEFLAKAKASPDARLRALAERLAARLEAGAPCYGALGPGLNGLLGPAPTSDDPGAAPEPGVVPADPAPVEPAPGAPR